MTPRAISIVWDQQQVQIKMTPLFSKGLVWLIGAFAHANNAIVYQSLNVTECVNCPPKVTPVMYKRVCGAPVPGIINTWSRNLYFVLVTYAFFLGPSCRASTFSLLDIFQQ